MVVMYPHQIARFVALYDRLREDAIRLNVSLPIFGVELQLGWEIVKHRPQRLIRVAFIESGRDLFRQLDREALFLLLPILKNASALFLTLLAASTSPTNPIPAIATQNRVHCARQPTRASLGCPAAVSLPQAKRQTVRNDDQSI